MDLNCASLKPNISSLFPNQDVRNCVHDTEANSALICNGASIHANICNL